MYLQRPLDFLLFVALDLVANLEFRPTIFKSDTALGVLVHGLHILLLVFERADGTCQWLAKPLNICIVTNSA